MTTPRIAIILRPPVRAIERICWCGRRFAPTVDQELRVATVCSKLCKSNRRKRVIQTGKPLADLPSGDPVEGPVCRACGSPLVDDVSIELGTHRICRVMRAVRRRLSDAGKIADHLKARKRAAVAARLDIDLPIVE